jgi:fructose-1,6-bisphosphatase I
MAFIAEQAGGKASDGRGNRILDIKPESLHQRIPIYVGSRQMVDKAEDLIMEFDKEGI